MLRKLGNITTMCLLLISTTGFAVSEHYCGTNLVSIEVNKEAESCCDNPMCCHTEMHFFHLDEDFVSTEVIFDFGSTFVTDLFFQEILTWNNYFTPETENHHFRIGESPPPPERDLRLALLQRYIL